MITYYAIFVGCAAVIIAATWWLRGWWDRGGRALGAGYAKIRQVNIEGTELAALQKLASRPVPASTVLTARHTADKLRATFPDVPDRELARMLLHSRWVVLDYHHRGRNCVQIAGLLGLTAVELTQLDREVASR